MIKLILYSPRKVPSPHDGLPFWVFWFLLSLIGLLILFIFLRNKELRRRIDSFFLQIKKGFLSLHLKHQIKREEKRKEKIWWELGKIVYEHGLAITGAEIWLKNLRELERQKDQLLAHSAFEHKAFLKWPQPWKKNSNKLKSQFKGLEEQFHTGLIKLGKMADAQRNYQEKLIPFYEKIDTLESKLSHLEKRLHSLNLFLII